MLQYLSVFMVIRQKDTTFEVINNAKGYIRRELAGKIRIKYIPEISFKMDESIEYGIHINKLLEKVKNQDQGEKEGT